MTEKYKIIAKFVKDMTSETSDIETYLFVRDHISKYQLKIDINSKPLKNKMIEINTGLKFQDKEVSQRKSFFELIFTTIIKITNDIPEKKDLEKIVLCDVQIQIYPDLEKIFLSLLENSGYPGFKFDKKIDFVQLYNDKFN